MLLASYSWLCHAPFDPYPLKLELNPFFSRIYTADLTLSFGDGLKAVCLCLFELVFLRFILAWVRCTAFIGYRKKKLSWGRIERRKIDLK